MGERKQKKLAGLLAALIIAGTIPLTASVRGSDLGGKRQEKQQVENVTNVGGSWSNSMKSQAMWYLPVATVGIVGIIIIIRKGGKKTDFRSLNEYGLPRS